MCLIAGLTRFKNGYCEPRKAMVFSERAFERLFPTQPWKQIKTWQDGRYQYAVCEKPCSASGLTDESCSPPSRSERSTEKPERLLRASSDDQSTSARASENAPCPAAHAERSGYA